MIRTYCYCTIICITIYIIIVMTIIRIIIYIYISWKTWKYYCVPIIAVVIIIYDHVS